jgi:hypothetical protein
MIVMVDTNVAIAANGKSEQVSPQCILECVEHLKNIIQDGRVALDDKYRILTEYKRYLSPEGQPGVGDGFFRWLLLNQSSGKCEFVKITPLPEDDMDFEEFPHDDRLIKFDRSDRKWIAVSRAHQEHPPISQATDTKWAKFAAIFAEYDVKIEFLCGDM